MSDHDSNNETVTASRNGHAIAMRHTKRHASHKGRQVSERLSGLVLDSLRSAAERLLSTKEDVFSLLPLNPVRVVVALSGGRDSMTLLDVVARLFHRHDQYLISRVDAVTSITVSHRTPPPGKSTVASNAKSAKLPFTPSPLRSNAGEKVSKPPLATPAIELWVATPVRTTWT